MVFKTRADDKSSHWAHIMCDPNHKSWHSIELVAANRDSEERAKRLGEAKPKKGRDCTWPSNFPHIDVDPDM